MTRDRSTHNLRGNRARILNLLCLVLSVPKVFAVDDLEWLWLSPSFVPTCPRSLCLACLCQVRCPSHLLILSHLRLIPSHPCLSLASPSVPSGFCALSLAVVSFTCASVFFVPCVLPSPHLCLTYEENPGFKCVYHSLVKNPTEPINPSLLLLAG